MNGKETNPRGSVSCFPDPRRPARFFYSACFRLTVSGFFAFSQPRKIPP